MRQGATVSMSARYTELPDAEGRCGFLNLRRLAIHNYPKDAGLIVTVVKSYRKFSARGGQAPVCLGWVLLRRVRHLEAGAAFKRAIDLEPGFASAHEGLGVVLSQEKRYAC